MVNKFLLVIAGIVAVMAVIVLVPRLDNSSPEQQDLSVEYIRQNITRLEDGRLAASIVEDLVIRTDRSAVYNNFTGEPDIRQFVVSGEEMNSLKGLVLSTGFMEVPGADYPQKERLGNLTKYSLKLASGSNTKSITWVNLEASQGVVPPIVRNIGMKLDAIMDRLA